MYMDSAEEYRALSLFRKYNVDIEFSPREFRSPDGKYRLVYCRVPKNQVVDFEAALSELPAKMYLLGLSDYNATWERLLGRFVGEGVS